MLWRGCVAFLTFRSYDNIDLVLMDNFCLFFKNDVDIQLILELKSCFGKYHLVFSKNPKRNFDTLYNSNPS